jgi:hypothetical protein
MTENLTIDTLIKIEIKDEVKKSLIFQNLLVN